MEFPDPSYLPDVRDLLKGKVEFETDVAVAHAAGLAVELYKHDDTYAPQYLSATITPSAKLVLQFDPNDFVDWIKGWHAILKKPAAQEVAILSALLQTGFRQELEGYVSGGGEFPDTINLGMPPVNLDDLLVDFDKQLAGLTQAMSKQGYDVAGCHLLCTLTAPIIGLTDAAANQFQQAWSDYQGDPGLETGSSCWPPRADSWSSPPTTIPSPAGGDAGRPDHDGARRPPAAARGGAPHDPPALGAKNLKVLAATVSDVPARTRVGRLMSSSRTVRRGRRITLAVAGLRNRRRHAVRLVVQRGGYRGERILASRAGVAAAQVKLPKRAKPGRYIVSVLDASGMTGRHNGLSGTAELRIGTLRVRR